VSASQPPTDELVVGRNPPRLIEAGVKLGVTCVETLFEGGVIGDAKVVTNSTKLRAYAPAIFFPDEELLEIMVTGRIGS